MLSTIVWHIAPTGQIATIKLTVIISNKYVSKYLDYFSNIWKFNVYLFFLSLEKVQLYRRHFPSSWGGPQSSAATVGPSWCFFSDFFSSVIFFLFFFLAIFLFKKKTYYVFWILYCAFSFFIFDCAFAFCILHFFSSEFFYFPEFFCSELFFSTDPILNFP